MTNNLDATFERIRPAARTSFEEPTMQQYGVRDGAVREIQAGPCHRQGERAVAEEARVSALVNKAVGEDSREWTQNFIVVGKVNRALVPAGSQCT